MEAGGITVPADTEEARIMNYEFRIMIDPPVGEGSLQASAPGPTATRNSRGFAPLTGVPTGLTEPLRGWIILPCRTHGGFYRYVTTSSTRGSIVLVPIIYRGSEGGGRQCIDGAQARGRSTEGIPSLNRPAFF